MNYFKGMLYFYSWHSIPHSIREKMVGAGRVRSGWDQIKTVCAICSVLNLYNGTRHLRSKIKLVTECVTMNLSKRTLFGILQIAAVNVCVRVRARVCLFLRKALSKIILSAVRGREQRGTNALPKTSFETAPIFDFELPPCPILSCTL